MSEATGKVGKGNVTMQGSLGKVYTEEKCEKEGLSLHKTTC